MSTTGIATTPDKVHDFVINTAACIFVGAKGCDPYLELVYDKIAGVSNDSSSRLEEKDKYSYHGIDNHGRKTFEIETTHLTGELQDIIFNRLYKSYTYDGDPVASELTEYLPGHWSADPACAQSCLKLCHAYKGNTVPNVVVSVNSGGVSEILTPNTDYDLVYNSCICLWTVNIKKTDIDKCSILSVVEEGERMDGLMLKRNKNCSFSLPFEFAIKFFGVGCDGSKKTMIMHFEDMRATTDHEFILPSDTEAGRDNFMMKFNLTGEFLKADYFDGYV